METKRFLFVPYEIDSPEVRRILSRLQENKKRKSVSFVVLFFSLIFNLFLALCIIATIFLPPGSLSPTAKKIVFGFCLLVIFAAMGVLIGILGSPEGED